MAKYTYLWDRTIPLPYWKQIANLSPIAFWMLDERDDTLDCMDNSYYASHGSYSAGGITYNSDGIGDGHYSKLFDGAAGRINLLTAGTPESLATNFDGSLGEISVYIKIPSLAIWTDSIDRPIIQLEVDAQNYIYISKLDVDYQLNFVFKGSNVFKSITYTTNGTLDWIHLRFTWDTASDQIEAFVDGVSVGTASGLGAWVGALTSGNSNIGYTSRGGRYWSGNIQHVAVFDDIVGVSTFESETAAVGDSKYEPWNALEVQHVLGNVIGDFVFPQYGNELEAIESGVAGGLYVQSGAAFAKGCLYISDDTETLNFSATVANPRVDAIVLYKDIIDQTVRLAVREGTEAAAPAVPTLLDGDVLLYYIYVIGGWNPAVNYIQEEYIHDRRPFRHIGPNAYLWSYDNILPNSEFCAFSGAATGNLPPDGWALVGTPTIVLGTKHVEQPRGNGIDITGTGAAEGIQIYVPSEPNDIDYTVTFKGLLETVSGTTIVTLSAANVAGATANTITRWYTSAYPTEMQEITLRTTIPVGYEYVLITFTSTAQFYVGQCLLTRGYIAGNFRPIHEIIMFDYDLNDAAWTATAKSTGTTTIDCAASFSGVIPGYIRGIIMRMRARDSGSGAGSARLYCYHRNAPATYNGLVLDISGITNDTWREQQGFIPSDLTRASTQFIAEVVATGAGTLDATLQPVGIIT